MATSKADQIVRTDYRGGGGVSTGWPPIGTGIVPGAAEGTSGPAGTTVAGGATFCGGASVGWPKVGGTKVGCIGVRP
ncbi:MAG: hypothetical protein ACR2NM_04580, partial [Bythopirellula sp.]